MTLRSIQQLGRTMFINRGLWAGLLLGWSGAELSAQNPPRVPPPPMASASESPPLQRMYLNKSILHLPIQVNESSRTLIKEIHLYVKEQPTAPWTLRDTVAPDKKAFVFQAPRDGEYAFTMVTVDKQNRSIPADIRNEPPALVVVIDTQRPLLELTSLGKSAEGQLIQCEVRDANPNQARLRMFFQGGDQLYRPMDALPDRPNVFCVPTQAVCTGLVRATAEDLAGNQTTLEKHVSQLPTNNTVMVNESPLPIPRLPQEPKTTTPTHLPKVLPSDVQKATPIGHTEVRPIPKMPVSPEPTPPNTAQRPQLRPDGSDGPRFVEQGVHSTPGVVVLAKSPHNAAVPPPPGTDIVLVNSSQSQAALPQAGQATAKDLPKRQLVNQSKVYLDYQIENVDANYINKMQSGQGKVEVWITRNHGQHWHKQSETPHGKNPVEVQLAEDGLYGVALVVTNDQGVGGTPPVTGDAPDWLIEVDTTRPTAQITNLQTVQENNATTVVINWSASDKNLGETPVELSYAATMQGPWLPIAKGLKGEGQYRWTPPTDIGVQAFLRLSARDLAGNVSVSSTLEPIRFEEPARPRAVIRSIRTEATTPLSGTP